MNSFRPDETWHRLRTWTQGQTHSERLGHQILIFAGYRDLDPSHPMGGPDEGIDAISHAGGETGHAIYFPVYQQKFSNIKKKFKRDLERAKKKNEDIINFAFITNQNISKMQRKELIKLADPLKLDLFHLERITTILDTPEMERVRRQYLMFDDQTSNSEQSSADYFQKLAIKIKQALPYAKKLVTEALPPTEFLEFLENYNFRSGRIPIEKQVKLCNFLNKIHNVIFLADLYESLEDRDRKTDLKNALQNRSAAEVLPALPALRAFYDSLNIYCHSVYVVTSTELGANPTHLGIFNTQAAIDTRAEGFNEITINWEYNAYALATAYRTEILEE